MDEHHVSKDDTAHLCIRQKKKKVLISYFIAMIKRKLIQNSSEMLMGEGERERTDDLINLDTWKELHKFCVVVKGENKDSGARVPGFKLELDCH